MSHMNRGAHRRCRNPRPEEVRALWEWSGLTEAAFGDLICASEGAVQQWKSDVGTQGHRRMHGGFWCLIQLELGLDPTKPLGPQIAKKR